MSELPKGWVEATLRDVVDDYESIDPKTSPNKQFSYVDIGAIDNSVQKITSPKEFRGRDAPSRARRVVRTNDVLFSTVRTHLKNVAQVQQELDGQLASTGICILRANEAVDPGYLFRWVGSDAFIDEISQAQDGTMYPAVREVDVLSGPIPLAPLTEQKRIVRKLDTLSTRTTTVRTHLTTIAKLAQNYKAGVLDAAFSGHEDTAELGALIDGIKAGKNLKCEERPPQEGERGTIKVSAVTWGEFRPDQSKTYPSHFEPDPETLIKPGDFLFSRANTIELVGAVVIVEETPGNLFLSDKVLRVDMSEDLKPWLLWFLRSPKGRSQLEGISSGNQQSMRNIGQAKLKTVNVPFPGVDVRAKILSFIQTSFEMIDRLESEAEKALKAAERLDKRILAKAFAGELVLQDPIDEPASALLERIREARANAPKKPRTRRTKATAMKQDPKEILLADSSKWSTSGVTPEELAERTGLQHDALRDALFELLGGTNPRLEQVFDKTEERMRLIRVSQ